MQGTVARFDADGSGSVLLDDGTQVPFRSAAFRRSGLRLLRPGQRVRLTRDRNGAIDLVTLVTFPDPPADQPADQPPTGPRRTSGRS